MPKSVAPVRVRVESFVPAPCEVVYAALLDPTVHAETSPGRERVVSGNSPLGLGDEVTFEAWHFGLKRRLTAKITLVDPPNAFEDTMVKGDFRHLWHRHEFETVDGGTKMVDLMEFKSPAGRWFDQWILAPYLRRFLEKRAKALADSYAA